MRNCAMCVHYECNQKHVGFDMMCHYQTIASAKKGHEPCNNYRISNIALDSKNIITETVDLLTCLVEHGIVSTDEMPGSYSNQILYIIEKLTK